MLCNVVRQIEKALKNIAFDEKKLICVMAGKKNSYVVAETLKLLNRELDVILDNNDTLKHTNKIGIPIYKPEKILSPFNPKALIFVYSPKYYKQMSIQLEGLGYKKNKHFYLLHDDFLPINLKYFYFFINFYRVLLAKHYINQLKNKYGQDVHFLMIRCATGDVYLVCKYLKQYLINHGITNYIILGDAKGITKIPQLFGYTRTLSISSCMAEYVQHAWEFYQFDNFHLLLYWRSLPFHFSFARMLEKFTFLDSFHYWIFNNEIDYLQFARPEFKECSPTLIDKYKKLGVVKGKTVIISPFAYSVKKGNTDLWQAIIDELVKRGYKVFVNIDKELEVNSFTNCKEIFFPYNEAKVLLEYAGYFLAIRSGLCDILSDIDNCKRIILYPIIKKPYDLTIHRSVYDFCNFESMHYSTKNLVEISTEFFKDFWDYDAQNSNNNLEIDKNKLITCVLEQFSCKL